MAQSADDIQLGRVENADDVFAALKEDLEAL